MEEMRKEDTLEEEVSAQEACGDEGTQTEQEAAKDEVKDEVKEETPDEKLKKLLEQLASEKEKLLRTAAEYANFRSRTEREKLAIYSNAVSDTVKELLPIADSIDRALDASKDAPEEFRKGLEMISNQLAKTFEKLNIKSFGEVGDVFDPELHNAISSVDSDDMESDTIAMVYQKGYKVGDKIIRHCMVQTVN